MIQHWLCRIRLSSGTLAAGMLMTLVCGTWILCGQGSAADLPKNPETLTPAEAVNAYLAVLLDETQTNIRRNYAAGQILKLGKPAGAVLVERYKTAGAGTRGYLAALLGAMGANDEAEKALVADLKDSGSSVHPNVIKALGQMRSSKARPLLVGLLPGAKSGEEGAALRLTILQAIADNADESTLGILKEALGDNDRLVRMACANGLVGMLVRQKQLKDGQGTNAEGISRADRDAAGKAYVKMLDEVLDYCRAGKSEDARVILIEGVGDLQDDQAVDAMMDVLKKGSPVLRAEAADALGKLKARVAVTYLTDMLGQGSAGSRAAVRALTMIGDDRCVAPLIRYLEKLVSSGQADSTGERKEIVKALQTVTHQGFGDSPEAWRNWWTSQKH